MFPGRSIARSTSVLAASMAAAILAVGLALSAPAWAEPPLVDWLQFHGEPQHRGENAFEQTVGPANVNQLGLKWIGNGLPSKFGNVYRSSPAVVGGLAFFGDTDGNFYAFPANGCGNSVCPPVWWTRLVESIYDSPAVADGIVYVGTASPQGALYAFPAAGCGTQYCTTPLWKSTPLSIIESSPTVANGVVYVGSDEGIYAFDAQGCGAAVCEPLWIGRTEGMIDNSPAVADGVVYVGAGTSLQGGGRLYAFAAAGCGMKKCLPLWTGSLGTGLFSSSAAVADGVVYIGSFWNGGLYAFAAGGCGFKKCLPLWVGDTGIYEDSSPAVAGGYVYIGTHDSELKVFRADGCGQAVCQPVWVGFVPGSQAGMDSPPMVANGVVYIGGMASKVAAFDALGCGQTKCEPLWYFQIQDPIVNSSPVMVNGTLYVTSSNFGITPQLYVFTLP